MERGRSPVRTKGVMPTHAWLSNVSSCRPAGTSGRRTRGGSGQCANNRLVHVCFITQGPAGGGHGRWSAGGRRPISAAVATTDASPRTARARLGERRAAAFVRARRPAIELPRGTRRRAAAAGVLHARRQLARLDLVLLENGQRLARPCLDVGVLGRLRLLVELPHVVVVI